MNDEVRNLRKGVEYGLALATFYSLFALLMRWVHGAAAFRDPPVSILSVVVGYFVGGLVAGSLVGFLLPLTRTKLGAAVVGLVVSVPALYPVSMLFYPPSEWLGEGLLTVSVTGLFLGPLCGLGAWYVHRDFRRR